MAPKPGDTALDYKVESNTDQVVTREAKQQKANELGTLLSRASATNDKILAKLFIPWAKNRMDLINSDNFDIVKLKALDSFISRFTVAVEIAEGSGKADDEKETRGTVSKDLHDASGKYEGVGQKYREMFSRDLGRIEQAAKMLGVNVPGVSTKQLVIDLQTAMANRSPELKEVLGLDLGKPIDGIYGPRTARAVRLLLGMADVPKPKVAKKEISDNPKKTPKEDKKNIDIGGIQLLLAEWQKLPGQILEINGGDEQYKYVSNKIDSKGNIVINVQRLGQGTFVGFMTVIIGLDNKIKIRSTVNTNQFSVDEEATTNVYSIKENETLNLDLLTKILNKQNSVEMIDDELDDFFDDIDDFVFYYPAAWPNQPPVVRLEEADRSGRLFNLKASGTDDLAGVDSPQVKFEQSGDNLVYVIKSGGTELGEGQVKISDLNKLPNLKRFIVEKAVETVKKTK